MSEGQILCLTFILINFLTNINLTSHKQRLRSGKLIFRHKNPLRYSRDFLITEFDIIRFEIQSNIGEMLGIG